MNKEYLNGLVFGALVTTLFWISSCIIAEQAKVNSGHLSHRGKLYQVELVRDFQAERIEAVGKLEVERKRK